MSSLKVYVSPGAEWTHIKVYSGPSERKRTSAGMLKLRTGAEADAFLDKFNTSELELDEQLGNFKEGNR